MGHSKKKSARRARRRTLLAKPLAPEDVRPGDFVTLLHVVAELPSFLWCIDAVLLSPQEPVRIQLVPRSGGIPLQVKDICLPFVLVKAPCGQQRTVDVRQCRLARLDRTFARASWRAYKLTRSSDPMGAAVN